MVKDRREERTKRKCPGLHVPRTVFELRFHEEGDPSAVCGIRRGQTTGLIQCDQRLAGCIGIARECWKLSPSAVGSLLGKEFTHALSYAFVPPLASAPTQTATLH